jgi:type II secretory pathway pseudopilin PulG
MKKSSKNEAGIGLIALVVSIGILGILLSVAITMFTTNMKYEKSQQTKDDIRDIRKYIHSAFSCNRTVAQLPAGPCAQDVEVRSAADTILVQIPNNGTYSTFGGLYPVRARCVACVGPTCYNGKRLLLETQRVEAGNQPDPNSWVDLSGGTPPLCRFP